MLDPSFPLRASRLLAQGGLVLGKAETTKYDPTRDPEGAAWLAARLASELRHLHPSIVAIWTDPEDIILAHLLALELDLRWVQLVEDRGSLSARGKLSLADSVVFVTDALRGHTPLEAIRGAIESHGARLVGTCVFLATPRLDALGPENGAHVAVLREPGLFQASR